MKILALEFSSPQRSVAVVQSGSGSMAHEVIETAARGGRALDMVEDVLREAKLQREEIDTLAVGIGPGSYTGIRAAISLAQGWQLARDVKLLGVSSAEGIARQAQADGMLGRVSVVIDAQRNEFYLADYELDATTSRETSPLRLASLADVQAREQAGYVLIGPEVARWFPSGRMIFPRATMLGQLALSRKDFLPGEKLEPIYLRETTFVKAPPPRPAS